MTTLNIALNNAAITLNQNVEVEERSMFVEMDSAFSPIALLGTVVVALFGMAAAIGVGFRGGF